jgi:hypothetical protein
MNLLSINMAIMHGGFDEEGEHITDTYLLDLAQMIWIKIDLPTPPSISTITNLAENVFVFGGVTIKDHQLDYSASFFKHLEDKNSIPQIDESPIIFDD